MLTNVKCSVLFNRAQLRSALEVLESKERPKGLAFKVDGIDKDKPEAMKKKIDSSKISIIPVWYEDGHMTGDADEIVVAESSLIKINGKELKGSENPIWEYADVFNDPKSYFTFSYFDYDALDLIINKIGDKLDEEVYDKLLLGSIKSELGDATEDNISAIHGESFAFKLEPYKVDDDKEGHGIANVIKIGVPLFAIGLSCQKTWEKEPLTWMSGVVRKSYVELFNTIEDIGTPV